MRLLNAATIVLAGSLLGACASVPSGPGYASVSAGTAVCTASPCPPVYPYGVPFRGPGVYGAPYYYGSPYYGAPFGYGPSPGFGIYRGRTGRFRGFR